MKLAFDLDTLEIDEIFKFLEVAKGFHFELQNIEDKGLVVFVTKVIKEE